MSPTNNIAIDEKLLDSYRDLTKKVKDVKVELVTTADEIEELFSKLSQGIVRQELQVASSNNAILCEQFSVGKSLEEVSIKLPPDYEACLQEMRDLNSVALQFIRRAEEFEAEN